MASPIERVQIDGQRENSLVDLSFDAVSEWAKSGEAIDVIPDVLIRVRRVAELDLIRARILC